MGYQIRYENEKKTLLEQVGLADNFMSRLIGLTGRKSIGTQEGLLPKKISCIRMCFMCFSIYVVYLGRSFCVIDKETVKPWRCGRFCKGAVHVLEMHESRLKDIRLSEKLVLENDGRERRAQMDMFDKMGREEPDKIGELGNARRQYEQVELKESLRTVLFGGYSRKKVNETTGTYKEMTDWMQGSFDYRLKELGAGKERVYNECVILKKQPSGELEKNKKMDSLLGDTRYWKSQYKELMARCEAADKSLLTTQGKQVELLRQCSVASKRLEELEAELEILRRQKQSVPPKQQVEQVKQASSQPYEPAPASGGGTALIAALARQLEHLTTYCRPMENQQRSLGAQISSTKNTSQELKKLSLQYEEDQVELKDVCRKYNSAKNKSYSLNSEMESTSQILEEILVQFKQRKQESDRLHQEINECQEQLMAVKKEKLTQDQSNLTYMEWAYRAEKEVQKIREELRRAQKELEELHKEYSTPENSKAIKIQSATGTEEVDIPGKEKTDELLRRASAVTGQSQKAEKSPPGIGTLSITSDKEVLWTIQNEGGHEPINRRVKREYLQECG